MNKSESSGRRQVLVAATAALTALATMAGLAALAVATSSSLASAAVTSTDSPSQGATPSALSPTGTPTAAPAATAIPTDPSEPPPVATATGSTADIDNVVFVLADDLDWELFDQVPRLAALKAKGLTFTNHTVTDSLCCPSRTSILRGQYIHNHRVVSNLSTTGGGWPTFRDRGEDADCLPVWLQSAGVTTALFGKFLNEYPETPKSARTVPPGWSQWGVPVSRGDSYTGYDYIMNSNGRLVRYGQRPDAFLNDVITAKATDFIRTAPEGFFLTLSTYNPHKPAPVAVRHKGSHLTSIAPRTPNYNMVGTNEPSWISALPVIPPWKQSRLDGLWRQRAQSAESVADSVDSVLATLEATGRAANTLVVVTSDNGYHVGSHRLTKGKRTAFREDTVVPMVVIGPGVAPGSTFDGMTSTIDLAPTFTALLGASAPSWVDGRSLTDIIATAQTPVSWRTATVSESMGTSVPGDPDYQQEGPPNFAAIRTPQWLFVVYRDGEREMYDLTADPYELNNIIGSTDPAVVSSLNSQLQALRSCRGETCRTADSIIQPNPVS